MLGRGTRAGQAVPCCVGLDLTTHLRHIQLLRLLQELAKGPLRQRARLGEDDDLVPEDHEGGDRADLEMGRDLLLVLGVDLRKHDVVVIFRDLLIDRSEGTTRTTPGRPKIHDDKRIVLDGLLEVVFADSTTAICST